MLYIDSSMGENQAGWVMWKYRSGSRNFNRHGFHWEGGFERMSNVYVT